MLDGLWPAPWSGMPLRDGDTLDDTGVSSLSPSLLYSEASSRSDMYPSRRSSDLTNTREVPIG